MITEIIAFELLEGVSHDQLLKQADKVVNDFHKKQDGYIDMELDNASFGDQWQMIVHYQSMDDIEKVKNNLPHSKAIKEFTQLLAPNSMKVSFFKQQACWSS